jgi:transcriptional regulator with XRE-family HTH domain
MSNERLHTLMTRARVTPESLADICGVDPKTVRRWLAGRVPYPRHRSIVAVTLSSDEEHLWPQAVRSGSLARKQAEILGTWPHRADVPMSLWRDLVARATTSIDISGYAIHFLPEQYPCFRNVLAQKAAAGCRVRITLCDPDGPHALERDALEKLGGTLPGHIKATLSRLLPESPVSGLSIGLHDRHLYSTVYRFDDEMLLSTHLIGQHGHQHPVWHLQRTGPESMFDRYLGEFEQVWSHSRPVSGREPDVGAGA